MSLDTQLIAYVIRHNDLTSLQHAGISEDDFVDENRLIWKYLLRMKRDHDAIPSGDTVISRFPDLELPKVKKTELPILINNIKQRRKYSDFLTTINDTLSAATSYESIDQIVQQLQGQLNTLAFRGGKEEHLVDLFSPSVRKQIEEEISLRRAGIKRGIPTGLKTLDRITGGLQKQTMITIIGRPGLGKSWLDLLFVANAVMNGSKVILYPLEMQLTETAMRLYTIFTQQCFGASKAIRHTDLTSGHVTPRRLARFLTTLEDKFKGQLYVADVAKLGDPYTNERIEAEVEIHKPDMFWVDYLTLMRPPSKAAGEDWQDVRKLSNGIKLTAMRQNVVGGCSAQVNREALRSRVFLPRLEHISYGDSIGQDADQVITINRRSKYLYYSLCKNRNGPEIPRTRVLFDVDLGNIRETEDEEVNTPGENDGG